jgi:hypothetical protein
LVVPKSMPRAGGGVFCIPPIISQRKPDSLSPPDSMVEKVRIHGVE